MRNMAMFYTIAAFVLLLWPLCVLSESYSAEQNKKSILRPTTERVFMRKKRWMVFPKGSNLKFTVNVSKRLLAMYPKGLSFNMEAAIYYPMPAARIDLIPKKFRKPTTKLSISTRPTSLHLVGIPGSLIKYRAKPITKPTIVQRINQNSSLSEWLWSPYFNLQRNNFPNWSKYSSPEYLKNYQRTPAKHEKYVNKYSKYNRKWAAHPKKYILPNQMWYHRQRYNRDIETIKDYEPISFPELEQFEDSPYYHSYRDRRELFYHFEGFSKMLGIDVKSCIMRAVCDSKRFLLPPGYSMIQDILRVVFTFPTINGLKDDYSWIMDADYHTCDAHITNKCPFSVLDWLLNSNKSK